MGGNFGPSLARYSARQKASVLERISTVCRDACGHRARGSRSSLRSIRTRAEVISGESQMPSNRAVSTGAPESGRAADVEPVQNYLLARACAVEPSSLGYSNAGSFLSSGNTFSAKSLKLFSSFG